MQQQWLVLDQPANNDQKATLVGELIASFPNLSNVEIEYFTRSLIQELTHEAPTLFVLDQTKSAVCRNHEFLSIKAVFDEMKLTQERAANRQVQLHDTDLEDCIIRAEEQLGLISKQEAEQRRKKRLGVFERMGATRGVISSSVYWRWLAAKEDREQELADNE